MSGGWWPFRWGKKDQHKPKRGTKLQDLSMKDIKAMLIEVGGAECLHVASVVEDNGIDGPKVSEFMDSPEMLRGYFSAGMDEGVSPPIANKLHSMLKKYPRAKQKKKKTHVVATPRSKSTSKSMSGEQHAKLQIVSPTTAGKSPSPNTPPTPSPKRTPNTSPECSPSGTPEEGSPSGSPDRTPSPTPDRTPNRTPLNSPNASPHTSLVLVQYGVDEVGWLVGWSCSLAAFFFFFFFFRLCCIRVVVVQFAKRVLTNHFLPSFHMLLFVAFLFMLAF